MARQSWWNHKRLFVWWAMCTVIVTTIGIVDMREFNAWTVLLYIGIMLVYLSVTIYQYRRWRREKHG